MKDVAFCTDSFQDPANVAYGERTLACLLWALIYADESYLLARDAEARGLQQAGGTPKWIAPLYQSGIVWRREEPTGRSACPGGNGQEQFLGVRQVYDQGHADCEDVASIRVAELRLGRRVPGFAMPPNAGHPTPTVLPPPYPMKPIGPNVLPAFFKRQLGPRSWMYHIVVFWPDGRFEDPSRVLGMGRSNNLDTFG